MTYLLVEIWMCLFVAALVGLLAGWLLWGRQVRAIALQFRDQLIQGRDALARATAAQHSAEARLAASGEHSQAMTNKLDECEKNAGLLKAELEAYASREAELVAKVTELEEKLNSRTMPMLVAPAASEFRRVGAGGTPVASSLTAAAGERDDLKKIRGIGPKLERALNERGVYRFEQIARWTSKDVDEFSKSLPEFKRRAERDDWIEGARAEHVKKYGG